MSEQVELAVQNLEKEEGWCSLPYYCTEGFPTIGFGFKIGKKDDPLPEITMDKSVGIGKLRALCDGLDHQFMNDKRTYAIYSDANPVRKAVLINMAYQIGFVGLMNFKQMWAALGAKNYKLAGAECLDSLAAKQTPARWKRNAQMIITGEIA